MFRIRAKQDMDMDGFCTSSRGRSLGQETSSSNTSQLDITEMLQRWKNGDVAALEKLTERIYGQLRQLANNALDRDWGNQSLQPTELVHESYLRLVGAQHVDWKSRAHFFAIASRVMRRILVDRARKRAAQKRGGHAAKISIEFGSLDPGDQRREVIDLVGLDLALAELALKDDELSRLVELRFFSGLTVEETAEVVGISARTVKRDWRLAKAWLKRRLNAAAR
jgi:RNA polymerase sigma factor (TIGR02999 family)